MSLSILHGSDFYDGAMCEREIRHKRVIKSKCVPVEVSPERLAGCVDYKGCVDPYRAARLVELLISEAHERAVGLTLGADQ